MEENRMTGHNDPIRSGRGAQNAGDPEKWGADAIRDCGSTDLQSQGCHTQNHSTLITPPARTTRGPKRNPDEVQQCYIMTSFTLPPATPRPSR